MSKPEDRLAQCDDCHDIGEFERFNYGGIMICSICATIRDEEGDAYLTVAARLGMSGRLAATLVEPRDA